MKSRIGYKLIIALVAVTVPAFASVSYLVIQAHYEQMIDQIKQQTYQLSETVKSSTKDDMLTKHRERVHRVIETIGRQQGIGRIRIYNKEGEIIFSTNKDEMGSMVDMRAEACVVCHAADKPLQKLNITERARIFRAKDGERYLGVINPIYNEPSCWTAACHAHNESQTVLGVLDFTAALSAVDLELATSRRNVILYSFTVIAAVSALLWLLVQHLVARPVGDLVEATNVIAAGDLGHRLDVKSQDELGRLAGSFNTMTEKLTEVQRQVYQQDKLASLGRLAAGLAHEINNPLTGILTYSSLALKRTEPGTEEQREMSVIVRETERCRDIVRRLLDFSRQAPSRKTDLDVNDVLGHALRIVENQLVINKIDIQVNTAEGLPLVNADGTQIEQVMINLIVNAIDAVEDAPLKRIVISTRPKKTEEKNVVELAISDSGKGIGSAEIHKIFEPFYTTKGQKGTGLGLSVVWGIIEDHQGTIVVQSSPGEGTSFVIELPSKD